MADSPERIPPVHPAANPVSWIVLASGTVAIIGLVVWGVSYINVPKVTASSAPAAQAPVPVTR